MPTHRRFPQILGGLHVTSGEHRIGLEGTPGRIILRVGSLGTLNEIRKAALGLMPTAAGSSAAPILLTGIPETVIAIGTRPVARIELHGGKPRVIPTPLKALTTKV